MSGAVVATRSLTGADSSTSLLVMSRQGSKAHRPAPARTTTTDSAAALTFGMLMVST